MPDKKPNILLINCDDLGYGDLACYGSKVNRTPFLDSLAQGGMRFTSCYAASPVCSPSRAALMTGCYPPRVGITRVLFPGEPEGLSDSEYTMARLLKDTGYRTMIVGKWHCGDQAAFLPCQHGFDRYFGLPYSNDMGIQRGHEPQDGYVPFPLIEDGEVIQEQPDQSALTERYVEHCIDFIRSGGQRPFFLYFAQMHVHLPLYAADRFCRESLNGDFGACVAELDWACAAIVDELKRLNMYENTLIIFTSDNGSRGDHGASNAPLRGGKFTTWEGGQRVPMIAHWAGHIPAGTLNDNIICHIDLLPTFARLAGGRLSGNAIDGVDQLDTFFNPAISCRDSMVYFASNKSGGDLNAYRHGKWKLHFRADKKEQLLLYDLESDIGESVNLAPQHPEIVEQLSKEAAAWREALGDKAADISGRECRAVGYVEHPKPLAVYRQEHPYIIAMYDKDDFG